MKSIINSIHVYDEGFRFLIRIGIFSDTSGYYVFILKFHRYLIKASFYLIKWVLLAHDVTSVYIRYYVTAC